MLIRDTFRNDISRRIEEVVKVDVTDDVIVAEEIGEYVVTARIEESLHDVLDIYRESIGTPSGLTNLWVSGFFGSGKSSFAKVLGYLLENRRVGEQTAGELFFPRCNDARIPALLETSWELAPAVTVFLELSSSQDVTNEAEGIVLPMYRALLARLDYAQTPKLAALEFDLETDGRLAAFEEAFSRVNGRDWRDCRDTVFAVNLASSALSAIDPHTFPAADSWAKSFEAPALTAKWLVKRAVDMVDRRGGGARRLVFVVDEVSQYIARSIDRIRAMQGVAERFQDMSGRLWLIATGQERLEEVVEGLEGKQSELQRLRDRFPITVDLLPSDIHEVVCRRVLDKRTEGREEINRTIAPHRKKLATNTRLISETRAAETSEEELVKLYPLVPYQVQLIIDAVGKRRSQVRSSAPMGGSNRTVIKHAQQLVTSGRVGLGDMGVGALVTIDHSYDLLEEVVPTSWRAEIAQVADKYTATSTEVQVLKVIALVHDVGSLPLTAHNLAVMLHPSIDAESRRDEVTAALGRLVTDDRICETDRGFQLQSVEQKQWDQERREIALGLGDELRLRKRLLTAALKGLIVTHRRAFAVGVTVDGEQRSPGDVILELDASTHDDHRDQIRVRSREKANENRVFWVFDPSPESWAALEELHKSERMIERHDVASKTTTDVQLLADEKGRQARAEGDAYRRLTDDLGNGDVIFQGRSDPITTVDLRTTAEALVRERLNVIYTQLEHFAAPIDVKEVMLVLRADDLGTLPDSLSDGGIGLIAMTASGAELVTDRDPLASFVMEVKRRTDRGEAPTGSVMERHLAAPPYGAPVTVVQALTAAGIRAGLIEVVHQGQPIANAGDRRLDNAFRTLPAFRQIEIRPPRDTGPDATTRSRLARKLQERTGEPQSPSIEELARCLRATFVDVKLETVIEVIATLTGASLVVPTVAVRARGILLRLRSGDDAEVVQTGADGWEDLVAGTDAADVLATRLPTDLPLYLAARDLVASTMVDLGEDIEQSQHQLRELLAAGDYSSHTGQIRELVARMERARKLADADLRAGLTDAIDAELAVLRSDFGDLDPQQTQAILSDLVALAPQEGAATRDALRSAVFRVAPVAGEARRSLEAIRSDGRLVEIHVGEIVRAPVADETQLSAALAAIRVAAEAQLADGKEVRLR